MIMKTIFISNIGDLFQDVKQKFNPWLVHLEPSEMAARKYLFILSFSLYTYRKIGGMEWSGGEKRKRKLA